MSEQESTNSYNKETYLVDYLVVLAKYSRMIIFTTVAVTVIVYLMLFLLPNKYLSKARLLPPQQNMTLSGQLMDIMGGGSSTGGNSIFGGFGGAKGMAASLLGIKSPGEVYVAMMESNTIRDHIIKRFDLMKLYKRKFIEDARKELSRNAKIYTGKKDGVIVISVTSFTPKQAAAIANAFIEELEDMIQKLAIQEAKDRLTFLEKERGKALKNLTKAEEDLRSFSEKNNVLQIDTQTRGVLGYIATLRAEIDSKEVGIQVLRQQATSVNPDMIRMETEVKALREKLRTAETKYDNCYTDVCLPTNKAPGLALEYARLYREAKFHEKLYGIYIKLMEIARLDMLRNNAVIQVIDIAKPPGKRSNTRLLPALLIGIITFLMMSFAAFGWDRIQNVKGREHNVRGLMMLNDYLKPWKDMLQGFKNIFRFKRRKF